MDFFFDVDIQGPRTLCNACGLVYAKMVCLSIPISNIMYILNLELVRSKNGTITNPQGRKRHLPTKIMVAIRHKLWEVPWAARCTLLAQKNLPMKTVVQNPTPHPKSVAAKWRPIENFGSHSFF